MEGVKEMRLKIGIVLVSLMLLVISPVAEAVEEQRVEETDPSFVWMGEWDSANNAQCTEVTGVPGDLSGGTTKVTRSSDPSPGTKVDITFTGTGIALIYATWNLGIVSVEIDNIPYDNIDMYSPDMVYQVKKVIATDLTNTQHVLTIICLGTKNPASASHGIFIDAVDVYAPSPAAFTVSNLVISPATVGVGQPVTITADVTNSGDFEGTYTVTLKIDDAAVENKDVTVAGGVTENVSFTVSKDTVGVYQVAVDGQTGAFAVFRITLTFRDWQRNALTNTSIYYGFSSGQETHYLGTTDDEGKITSDNSDLAGQTIYFRTSDGEYAGSAYVSTAGGEVTAELTEVPEISEFPILWVVAAVVIVAVAIGAVVFVKKRK